MKVNFNKPYFPKVMRKQILKDIDLVLKNKKLMLGEKSKELEEKFAKKIGSSLAISVNSATTGLQIALRFAQVKNNEVIIPAASFITNVNSVLFESAKPIIVDCNENTLTYDIKKLKKAINRKTKAIVWIHLTGYISPEYKKIIDLAKENKILLIEDASHAHGSIIDGKFAGTLGDVGIFSLYPTKVMTAGTGGVMTTNNLEIFNLAKSLRLFGRNINSDQVDKLGNDWFLDEVRCCIALGQLNNLDKIISKRIEAANYYYQNLPKDISYKMLRFSNSSISSWYNFPIFFKSVKKAKLVRSLLLKKNIACKNIYKPIFEEEVFKKNNLGINFPQAKKMLASSLCLPMFTDIKKSELEYIVKNFKEIIC